MHTLARLSQILIAIVGAWAGVIVFLFVMEFVTPALFRWLDRSFIPLEGGGEFPFLALAWLGAAAAGATLMTIVWRRRVIGRYLGTPGAE
ncbi:hypothetical protein LZ198_18025 [Myxococcus sp. K15C18031901]|uniref:hypothetical protein n=1 Tax=Myxococcus dinghuensis TaxID=2906761 RepID=UPI0020A7B582|nr:hypothetical protein [Myxococcus dinghuensis]MCP3100771.1 hypothetical protein [Myxococcus dinghuensis]